MPQCLDIRSKDEVAFRPDTILLAEADDVVRKALRRTLETRGYRVLEAISGEEAIRLCHHHDGPIDLLLSDISLNGLRGPALARVVTTLRPLTRVLFLTGEPEAINADAGICPGCWLLVRKPFRPRELALALHEFINRQAFQSCSTESLAESGLVEPSQELLSIKPAAS